MPKHRLVIPKEIFEEELGSKMILGTLKMHWDHVNHAKQPHWKITTRNNSFRQKIRWCWKKIIEIIGIFSAMLSEFSAWSSKAWVHKLCKVSCKAAIWFVCSKIMKITVARLTIALARRAANPNLYESSLGICKVSKTKSFSPYLFFLNPHQCEKAEQTTGSQNHHTTTSIFDKWCQFRLFPLYLNIFKYLRSQQQRFGWNNHFCLSVFEINLETFW